MQLFIPGIVAKYLDGHVKAPVFVMSLEDCTESSGANTYPLVQAIITNHVNQVTHRCHLLLNSGKGSTFFFFNKGLPNPKHFNDYSQQLHALQLVSTALVFYSPLTELFLKKSLKALLTTRLRLNMMKQVFQGRGDSRWREQGCHFRSGLPLKKKKKKMWRWDHTIIKSMLVHSFG